MTSPIATGGAGTHFESRVAAYYLAAALVQTGVRRLAEGLAHRVRLQRAFEGQPLDDVIVDAQTSTDAATLSLQVKRSIAFGDNALFHKVIAECWETLQTPSFREGTDRFGIALGITSAAIEEAAQNVLNWARQSADAADFFLRLRKPNFSSEDMRRFEVAVRMALEQASAGRVGDDVLWKFLKHFVIVRFDFERNEASENLQDVVERLRNALVPEDGGRAGDLWQALVSIADEAKPAAGSLDRGALVEQLHLRFRLAGLRQLEPDLRRIHAASLRVLDDIYDSLGGVQLPRQKLLAAAEEAVIQQSFVEVLGEPGSGKSAILKALAKRRADEGPVLLLDAKRLPSAPGLEGLERHLALTHDFDTLLVELSRVAHPCLFIDALDRITSPGAWTTVIDLLRAIRQSPAGARWSVVVTVRTTSLEHRTRLDSGIVGTSPGRIVVGALSDEELATIGAAHPSLAPLVRDGGRARDLARRPYLLARLLRSATRSKSASAAVVTEIDLMIEMWTDDGGHGPEMRLKRQAVLTTLGRRHLLDPGESPAAYQLGSPEGIQSLIADDILRADPVSGEVMFVHDILEDWTLCQILNLERHRLPQLLADAGQPLWLVEPVQLLAQWWLEREATPDSWRCLLDTLSGEGLDRRWSRAVLSAPLQSTRGLELISRVEPLLVEDDARRLGELMVYLRTVEVAPNPVWLQSEAAQPLGAIDPMEMALYAALPRPKAWRPFLAWLAPRLGALPPSTVEETSRVLETLPRSSGKVPDWLAKTVVAWARGWLRVLTARPWNAEQAVREQHESLRLKGQDAHELADRLRLLILASAGGAPDDVAAHLAEVASTQQRRDVEHIIENSNLLVPHLPIQLVKFLLATMVPPLEGQSQFRDRLDAPHGLGIDHDRMYSAASHLRPPFLQLLRVSPTEGLRLIKGLCNRAMEVWRHVNEAEGTPLPVRITFPWGVREFWGHGHEFMWYRGTGSGPSAVCSALMALEVWMEEQVAAGRDIEDLFRQVLEGNDCIGAVGVCVSIAVASPQTALKAALPLVTNPYLWYWDIHRLMNDQGSNVNLFGLPKDRVFLEPVAERNKLPHRQFELRHLVGHYLLNADPSMRTAFRDAMRRVAGGELPFEFTEQREHEPSVADLRHRLRDMAARADPSNYRIEKTKDGTAYLSYVHPEDLAPEAAAVAKEYEELTEVMHLAMWAEQSLGKGGFRADVSLEAALSAARDLDGPNLFDTCPSIDNFKAHNRVGAVAGVAACLLRYDEVLPDQVLAWCRDVVHRAAATPLQGDPYTSRSSVLVLHPTVFAVQGLAALVERGEATQEEREMLLALTSHPLEGVMEAAFIALARCWDRDPLLCWQAVVLCVRLSLMPRTILPRHLGPLREDAEAQWVKEVFREIFQDFRAGHYSALPAIPPHWVEDPTIEPPHSRYGRYRRSDLIFLWDVPPKSLFHQPVDRLIADTDRRQQVLGLVTTLFGWTTQDCAPPWRKQDTGHTPAFEWVSAFME